MEPFWKGTFAAFTKHLESVKLVTLAHMTQEDWDILDYTKLRPSARYNLDTQIVAGDLYGFYKVSVDQHLGKAHSPHGGKGTYFFPVSRDGLYSEPSQTQFPIDFGFDASINQNEVPPSPPGYLLLFASFILLTPSQQKRMLGEIAAAAPDSEDELLDEAFLLWMEVPRVLTLLARAYRVQDRDVLRALLLKLKLDLEEIQGILDEME